MVMMSVREASAKTGAHPKRLRKVLRSLGRLDAAAMERSDGSATFDLPKGDDLLDRIASSMSLTEAREYLGIPRPHDRLLLDAGFLVPWIRGGTEDFKDHSFAKDDLDGFLGKLLAGAIESSREDDGLASIPGAARRCDCSAMEIVRLVLEGRLRTRRIAPGERGYLSLLVDPEEISPLVRLEDTGGVTLREFERRTGLRTHVVKALVQGGHVPSRRVLNPVKRSPQDVVDELDVVEFERRYASTGRLASEAGLHARTLFNLLAEKKIAPAFPDVEGSPYERSALVEAGILGTPEDAEHATGALVPQS